MKLLGIESSCDETSAAVITTSHEKVTLLSNIVATSMQLHSQTGGIIPEIAAREQIKYIIPAIDNALREAHITGTDLDAIAVTIGPGLIGSLLVGVETAKALSIVWKKPIIPVNHLYGHLYANWINQIKEITFPALGLIVSGGHTDLVVLQEHTKLMWIAGTRDDAAGEAFDKIGRLLGLQYPAGPMIELLAKTGNPKRFNFPRPLLHERTFDFSFSGLKTAALREREKFDVLDEQTTKDLARATQDAIIDVLIHKTLAAAKEYNASSLILGGGVAANQTLLTCLTDRAMQTLPHLEIFIPDKSLCTDNAAMIATAGFYNNVQLPWQEITANPELYFD